MPDITHMTPSLRSPQGVEADYTPRDLSVKPKSHANNESVQVPRGGIKKSDGPLRTRPRIIIRVVLPPVVLTTVADYQIILSFVVVVRRSLDYWIRLWRIGYSSVAVACGEPAVRRAPISSSLPVRVSRPAMSRRRGPLGGPSQTRLAVSPGHRYRRRRRR